MLKINKTDTRTTLVTLFSFSSLTLNIFQVIKLQKSTLLTIYKTCILNHLDYTDAVDEQTYKLSFDEKLGSIQCNSVLAITALVFYIEYSSEKHYQGLGFKSLRSRRWFIKLCEVYEIL